MHQVQGEYPDYHNLSLRRQFYLKADQAFYPSNWHAPINWEGIVGEKNVRFIQTADRAFSINSFDWSGFPDELEEAKSYIVKAINKAMRTMD